MSVREEIETAIRENGPLAASQIAKIIGRSDSVVRDAVARARKGKTLRVVEWGHPGRAIRLTAYYGLGGEPDADKSVYRAGDERPNYNPSHLVALRARQRADRERTFGDATSALSEEVDWLSRKSALDAVVGAWLRTPGTPFTRHSLC